MIPTKKELQSMLSEENGNTEAVAQRLKGLSNYEYDKAIELLLVVERGE